METARPSTQGRRRQNQGAEEEHVIQLLLANYEVIETKRSPAGGEEAPSPQSSAITLER